MAGAHEGQPDPVSDLVSGWVAGLARPVSPHELAVLRDAARRLVRAAAGPAEPDVARAVGASLAAELPDPRLLPAATAALARLPGTADVQAALTEGYLTKLHATVRHGQEAVRRAEAARRAGEARLRAIFLDAGIGIAITDTAGRIVDANAAFASMLGYTVEEFCRLGVVDLVHPDDAAGLWDTYREVLAGRRDRARLEKRYRHRDGRIVWTDGTVSLIRDSRGAPFLAVAMAEDVTARRLLQERLQFQATHDPLTALPNRTLFQERLAAAFGCASGRVGICYLDLDDFKAVNDRLGHDVGDALLAAVAARLDRWAAARGHLAARMGGDEFVVLVTDPPAGALAGLAETVLAVFGAPFRVDRHDVAVSASIGVVECPVGDMTPAELLKAADVTLYWAKSDGRGRWACFDPERHAREKVRHTLAATLRPGLERAEFVVEYQPIVDVGTGRACGVEALVRWHHPTLGVLAPDRFIGLAEETGAIVPLGLHVLAQACAHVAAWNRAHPADDLFLSVNLAVRQAHDPALVADVSRILDTTGLPPRLLQLELTESALLGPAGRPVEAITALAGLGVHIAVDDFGTGYSNLSYLTLLPLHTLKLAGVFVDRLRDGPGGAEPIVAGLVALAHALGLVVTAEGVETPCQLDRLRAAGCDTVQGWLFARPAPWEEAVDLLDRPLPVAGGVPAQRADETTVRDARPFPH
jgi:diguanylate cyclase (GGDEF)-like protein/PAS domain S-box-containing protein